MNKDRLIIIVAGVSGLLAFFLIWHQMGNSKKTVHQVVVVKKEIPAKTILRAEMLKLSDPLKIKDVSDLYLVIDEAVGMQTTQMIPAGKGVRKSQVHVPSTNDGSLQIPVPPGLIVVTFTSKDIEPPPAFLTVGNYVDILGFASKSADKQTALVQSAQIVDVERTEDGAFKNLSVAMTPLEAETASGATEVGILRGTRISLALRLKPLIKSSQIAAKSTRSTIESMEIIRGSATPTRMVFGDSGYYATQGGGTDPSQPGGPYPGEPIPGQSPTSTSSWNSSGEPQG